MPSDKQDQKKRGGVRKTGNPKQRKARRSDFEYPSLEPSVNLGKRREEVEDVASYAHKLNAEEKAWLNQFMREYNEATTKDAVFHITAAERKICNDKNNARNRCWYTEEAAANRLNLVESDYEMERLLYSNGEIDEETEEEETSIEDSDLDE